MGLYPKRLQAWLLLPPLSLIMLLLTPVWLPAVVLLLWGVATRWKVQNLHSRRASRSCCLCRDSGPKVVTSKGAGYAERIAEFGYCVLMGCGERHVQMIEEFKDGCLTIKLTTGVHGHQTLPLSGMARNYPIQTQCTHIPDICSPMAGWTQSVSRTRCGGDSVPSPREPMRIPSHAESNQEGGHLQCDVGLPRRTRGC